MGDRFKIADKLGEGAFGAVFEAIDTMTGLQCVVKKCSLSTSDFQPKYLSQEIGILRSFHHPNVVGCIECYLEPKTICIAMEYVDGGDLRDFLNNLGSRYLDENEILKIFFQIASGVDYCHKQNVLHRDLKPENILLTKSHQVKICDFGLARPLVNAKNKANSTLGTINYMAPEILKSEAYSFPADIWGMGCILYELMARRRAFEGNSILEIGKQIVESDPLEIPMYSFQLKSILKAMFKKKPDERMSCETILSEISKMMTVQDLYDFSFILLKSGVYQQASTHFEFLSSLPHAPSIVQCGYILEKGFLGTTNLEQALDYYKTGLNSGDFYGMAYYSSLLARGLVKKPSPQELSHAQDLSKRAADSGIDDLILNYAAHLKDGVFGNPDIEGAKQYYKKAADQGNSEAMYQLGLLLEPTPEAMKWLQMAAQKNHPAACFHYGKCLVKAHPRRKTLKDAEMFVKKAATLGNEEAQQAMSDNLNSKSGEHGCNVI